MSFRCKYMACFRTDPHYHDHDPDVAIDLGKHDRTVYTEIENGEVKKVVELENVKLIHRTRDAEKLMAFCARVSSSNQDNPDLALLKYCLTHGHWSVFEMASMCLEITTSRAISPQILRHRSFSFQEFSQRYAKATEFVLYDARRQDVKNRQNSIDDLPEDTKDWFIAAQKEAWNLTQHLYQRALAKGIAKECARMVLPMSTETTIYMHGTVRSWIHYLQARTAEGVQKEHRDLVLQAREIFRYEFPVTAEALGWNGSP